MTHEEFIETYYVIQRRAMLFQNKARREGLLALEDDIDFEKAHKRDIFEYGIRFVVDGTDEELIEKILSNIINQEKDGYSKTLKTIQKEAVLSIQQGHNPWMLLAILNSYTDTDFEEVDDLLTEV